MILPVAILAGGTATRLQPLSRTIPKSMVEVAGRPFVDRQLEWLAAERVQHVVLCLGHLGEQVQEHVGNGRAFGLDVAYSYDGERLLGTGGALRHALPLLGPAFFVLYGDSFLNCPLAEVQAAFQKSGKPALMTVFENGGRWDTSNVAFRNGEVLLYDKKHPRADMTYIDYGLNVMRDAVLGEYPRDENFDLAIVYKTLSEQGRLAGLEVKQRFYEIGSLNGLADAESYFKNGSVQ